MSDTLKSWKTLDSREIFLVPNRITVSTQAVELANGERYEPYYRVSLADQAWVIAQTDDGRIVCQNQYKHGPQRVSLTLPGGIVDPGEEPLETAQRELLEETGYVCRDWQSLGSFCRNNNQHCGEEHFFLATGAEWAQDPDPTTNLEEIRTSLLTRDELSRAVANGDAPVLGHFTGMLLALQQMPQIPGD
ncbi:MAG: NUDIX hydrolase [Alphaproteobacteria bacterium]|nr:NUDIX hydrolase [Alphaproteobacteria bacterium]|tara:strand:- start:921 stop:1490 length:570 start_codon:yes stop_codon:yes gene_type:complete